MRNAHDFPGDILWRQDEVDAPTGNCAFRRVWPTCRTQLELYGIRGKILQKPNIGIESTGRATDANNGEFLADALTSIAV